MTTSAPVHASPDSQAILRFVEERWEESILPSLVEYIAIPNESPAFDPDWERAGHMDRAVELVAAWCEAHALEGQKLEVVRLPGRTPLIWIEVPGEIDDTVLLYGHLDKQPEMTGWRGDLGPWKPVLEGDRLYGRGGADDGYAAYASLTAIDALQRQGRPHARCVILIEACEESGSPDLPAYIEHLADRIGRPSLVICLDSGCGNYDQLWSTTSLRGLVTGTLRVDVLEEGVHSGDASGIVPSSFRVLRQLLDRIDDTATGVVTEPAFAAKIPDARRHQAAVAAAALGDEVFSKFPFVEGTRPVHEDLTELILNRTWRPALSITGVGGLPGLDQAGNVLRPGTALKLSLRLAPTADASAAAARLKQILEEDPPSGARVRFDADEPGGGWDAPPLAPWLEAAIDHASRVHFGLPAVFMGEGGSIPFMGMLGERFPAAQFLITGVLGPGSNAHGPNEFLHVPTGKRVTACVAEVLDLHARR
jgi:acetylornithine deacetylase/succinyl-diaminopimelate desuccinylase-like protein